ncbi:MAG: triose-phosphate isomerase [Wigglesworthia glossinidia]|nr:triose-phosphate isomerase [Wigglesworthia glossinidia]
MKTNPFILANWKLNGNILLVKRLLSALKNEVKFLKKVHIAIAPPVIYLSEMQKYLYNNKNIYLAAQNVDMHISGSFTGEISAYMLQEFGVRYVIIGHAERRNLHNEDDSIIVKKFLVLKKYNLIPVLCIGETIQDRFYKEIKNICIKQIDPILNILGIDGFKETIIAYEPIWAIGTGILPSPEYIQNVHEYIRSYLSKYSSYLASKIVLQYGGSVNSQNVFKILSQSDVNGVLLGKSSLKLKEFLSIIRIADKL